MADLRTDLDSDETLLWDWKDQQVVAACVKWLRGKKLLNESNSKKEKRVDKGI